MVLYTILIKPGRSNVFYSCPLRGKRKIPLQMFWFSPVDIKLLFFISLYILKASEWQESHPLPLVIFSVY